MSLLNCEGVPNQYARSAILRSSRAVLLVTTSVTVKIMTKEGLSSTLSATID